MEEIIDEEKKAKAAKNPPRPYPRISLQEALRVGYAIKEKNGGNPWTPGEIAKAIDIGAKTNDFYYYLSSSRDFGITDGTARSEKIALTSFGREILYSPDQQVEHGKRIEAFLKVQFFKKIFEYYKGTSLPDMKYLSNTLENEFKLIPEYHEEFAKLFKENISFINIIENDLKSTISVNSDSTRIVGELRNTVGDLLKAFVIMPFVEKDDKRPKGYYKEVLESLIIPCGIDAGFQVETANRQGSDVIQSTIIVQLLTADLVIADLTDHNQNVLFELGIRMATEKPVAIIKANDTGKIFDVDNMLRVYEYNSNLWKSSVESDLEKMVKHIKATWDNRKTEKSYISILTGKQ